MLNAILMVLLAVVSASAAARDFGWTWDKRAPQQRDAVVNPNAVAGWVQVASQKTYTVFVNPASIRKNGNNLEMLHLYELQLIDEVAGKPFRSVKARAEYNCKNEQSRILAASAYSGNMGQAQEQAAAIGNPAVKVGRAGVLNSISDPGKWKPVTPGSTEEILWKFACGK